MFPWPSLTSLSRVTVQKCWKIEFVLTGWCKPKGMSGFCEKVFLLSITMVFYYLNFAPSSSEYKWNFASVLLFILRGPSHLFFFLRVTSGRAQLNDRARLQPYFAKTPQVTPCGFAHQHILMLTCLILLTFIANNCPSCRLAKELLSSTSHLCDRLTNWCQADTLMFVH